MAGDFKLGYRPALDGMRAFAVLAVMGIHAGPGVTGFAAGYLGVDVFFTLSGFLITALLIEELERNERIWLAGFWARRVLRLVPALVALLAFVWLVSPWLWGNSRRGILPSLLYYMNWKTALGDFDVGILTYTWSLAIEEQFYLVWPLALIGLWKLDRTFGVALRVCVLVAVASAGARVVVAQQAPFYRWYRDFFLRADGLLIGCILALAVYRAGRVPAARTARLMMVAGVAALAAVAVINEMGRPSVTVEAAQHSVVALATASVVAAVLAGVAPSVLTHPVLVWIGVRSYGLYLWHGPFFRNTVIDMESVDVVLALVLTFAAAELSYRFVETPFLRLKSRVREQQTHDRVVEPQANVIP